MFYLHETYGCGQIESALGKGVKLYLIKSFGAWKKKLKEHRLSD